MIRHFVYSLLLRASIPAFGVINFMVIVRLFDEDQVGVWVLYMTILALIEVAKEGFLKNATIWLLNKESEEQTDSILSSSLRLNLITTLTICVAVVAAASILIASDYALLGYLLLLFVFQLLLNTLFNHFDYYLTSQSEFKQMMWAYLIKSFTLFALLTCSFVFWKSSVSLEWLVGFQTVGVILSILFLARKYNKRLTLRGADKQFSRRIVGFGRYVFATNVSSVLFRSTDHYMLAGLIGTGSVAYYNVALRITNLVDLPSTAAAEVIFPVSVKSSDQNELKKIYERTVGYILSLAIPFTLFIFLASEHIVFFIAGPSYSASVAVLQVTLVYGLLLPFLKQFGTMINAINKPKVNFQLMLVTFLLNVVFNYIFITNYGLLGAAYGTLLAYLVSFVANQIILNKYLSINTFDVLRYVLEAYVMMYKKAIKLIRK